jgi:3-methyladenine DNA glycosylase/8-oxoguanine DNA glycosylase
VTERVYRPAGPLALGATLATLRRGKGDPSHRFLAERGVWRATRTPDGPVLLRLVPRPAAGEVVATAWGPGAEWALDGVPQLLGDADDATGFEPRPEHAALVAAHRAAPGFRILRTRAVFEALAASAIEQRVTGKEAFAAWRVLVRRFGEPAPGPFGAALDLYVPPAPEVWRQIPSWVWLKAGVDGARSRVVVAAAAVAGRLERTVDLPAEEAERRLRTIPGVGIWTAAEVRQRAHGDPDAFSWQDYHVAKNVSYALTGTILDDAGCAQVIDVYRGHRYRVQRLLELRGEGRPRRGPRMTLPTHLPR